MEMFHSFHSSVYEVWGTNRKEVINTRSQLVQNFSGLYRGHSRDLKTMSCNFQNIFIIHQIVLIVFGRVEGGEIRSFESKNPSGTLLPVYSLSWTVNLFKATDAEFLDALIERWSPPGSEERIENKCLPLSFRTLAASALIVCLRSALQERKFSWAAWTFRVSALSSNFFAFKVDLSFLLIAAETEGFRARVSPRGTKWCYFRVFPKSAEWNNSEGQHL